MQSDQELISICKRIGVPLVGIFTKDQLPKQRVNGAYIINMQDDKMGQGTHWVGFIIENKHAAYFDSFGIHAPANVQLYLYPYRPYLYNTKQIQSAQTGYCGEYVSFWLKYMYQFHNLSLRQRMINFDRLWTKDTKESLRKLKMYMKDVFADKHFDNN